ncbi:XRE family transcriptional regulator [Schleiferia thermophila]|uniref:XRE family transcriptional regulator n=1 Tax=Schleiferia thermophila TaxID=884107 RepID=UPI003EEC7483
MDILAKNIKVLRKRKRLSQEQLAHEIGITRSAVNSYENKLADPPLVVLVKLADFFRISIDRLLKQDLSTLRESELSALERGEDIEMLSRKLRILTTAVTPSNENLTELVPEKAKAGYTAGYSDPEYISELPVLQLPFLSKNRKYRAFTISGDSMLPLPEGAIVIGEYVDQWISVKDGTPCILVTRTEGIVFKIVFNHILKNSGLLLVSTNPIYSPYEVKIDEILELWKFVYFISSDFSLPELSKDQLTTALMAMQKDLHDIKNTLTVGDRPGEPA